MSRRILVPRPHAGQLLVDAQARRFNILAAGRRWRKTTFTTFRRVLPCILNGKRAIWTAPTYDQVRVAWDELRHGAEGVIGFNASRMEATFAQTGGRAFFRSLDNPDNARSLTADLLVMDECQDCKESAWYEVLLPMLMDTHGEAWLQGTPKGKNWFEREYAAATDPDRPLPDTMGWQVPTLGVEITPEGLVRKPHPFENSEIPFEEIQVLFRKMTEQRFRQEILAEFIEDAGGVFRGVMACATAPFNVAPYRGAFVIGVDWGKAHDFTVFIVIDVAKWQVVDFVRFNQIDWPLQRQRLWNLKTKWESKTGRVNIVAEDNSIGNVLISELRRGDRAQGIPPIPIQAFETTSSSKQEGVEKLALLIETRRVSYPNIPILVRELQAFESKRMPSGLMKYEAPEGEFDDSVMAFVIAVAGLAVTPMIDRVASPVTVSSHDLDTEELAAL